MSYPYPWKNNWYINLLSNIYYQSEVGNINLIGGKNHYRSDSQMNIRWRSTKDI